MHDNHYFHFSVLEKMLRMNWRRMFTLNLVKFLQSISFPLPTK